jgi:RNA-directed DNA polymerase
MDLRRIRHREDLKNYLGTSIEHLTRLIEGAASDVFITHWIRKRNGSWREVWELRDKADGDFYKTFARLLDAHFREALPGYPHPASHGYVRGRSTLTNAKRHIGATKILKADLRAFFRNVTGQKVKSVLQGTKIQTAVIDDVLNLLVWDNHVPLGLCTSPLLVNAVALGLDSDLEQLAVGGRYTRYSDDLTFSGPPVPTVDALKTVVERHDFQLAEEKSHYLDRGRGLTVTDR